MFEELTAWGLTDSIDCGPWDNEYTPKDSLRMVGHWVMIYGWNDSCSAFNDTCFTADSVPCWLAKNSVGSDWGDPGPDSIGEDPGCFKLVMDEPLFRQEARVVKWTPLAKPVVKAPGRYSAFTVNTLVFPPDTAMKFVWTWPNHNVTEFRINIVEDSVLVHTEVVEDSSYYWEHPEPGSDYTWFVRAFNTNATSEKVSDWAGGDTVTVLSQPCCSNRGDFDHDSVIDINDLYTLSKYVNYDGAYPGCWEEADVDGDGDIDSDDLTYLSAYMYQSGPDPCPCDSTCN